MIGRKPGSRYSPVRVMEDLDHSTLQWWVRDVTDQLETIRQRWEGLSPPEAAAALFDSKTLPYQESPAILPLVEVLGLCALTVAGPSFERLGAAITHRLHDVIDAHPEVLKVPRARNGSVISVLDKIVQAGIELDPDRLMSAPSIAREHIRRRMRANGVVINGSLCMPQTSLRTCLALLRVYGTPVPFLSAYVRNLAAFCGQCAAGSPAQRDTAMVALEEIRRLQQAFPEDANAFKVGPARGARESLESPKSSLAHPTVRLWFEAAERLARNGYVNPGQSEPTETRSFARDIEQMHEAFNAILPAGERTWMNQVEAIDLVRLATVGAGRTSEMHIGHYWACVRGDAVSVALPNGLFQWLKWVANEHVGPDPAGAAGDLRRLSSLDLQPIHSDLRTLMGNQAAELLRSLVQEREMKAAIDGAVAERSMSGPPTATSRRRARVL